MNDIITIISLSILLITIIFFIKIWKFKVLFHPGFYFAIIWVVAVLSEWYLIKLDYAIMIEPKYIDELNVYVAFTSLCFLIWLFYGTKFKKIRPHLRILYKANYFEILSVISLLSVIISFIYSGASFNFGINRVELTEDKIHVFRQAGFVESIFSILRSTLPILSVLAGYYLGKKILGYKIAIKNIYLFIPILSIIIYTIMIGGRNPIAVVIKQYLLGLAFSLPYILSDQLKRKLLMYVIVVSTIFIVFTTIVANQRSIVSGVSLKKYDSAFTEYFSGIMEYMSAHYWGYQLRRDDYITNELKYGIDTFWGVIDIKIPFSSQVGSSNSLPHLFGINHDPLEIYKSDRIGSYTTNSIYIQIISDFGLFGAFIFLFLFTFYTHWMFLNMIKKPRNSAISFLLFYLCFTYWSSSNFSSAYGSNIFNSMIIPFFLFDIFQRYLNFRTEKNYYNEIA